MALTGFTWNGIQWVLDPLNKFSIYIGDLTMVCGIIPSFISFEAVDFVEEAVQRYGFGRNESHATVKDGVLSYPGDPDLYPVACTTTTNRSVYIYEYGLVAFIEGETTVVLRMD